jgi:hypothetical protein
MNFAAFSAWKLICAEPNASKDLNPIFSSCACNRDDLRIEIFVNYLRITMNHHVSSRQFRRDHVTDERMAAKSAAEEESSDFVYLTHVICTSRQVVGIVTQPRSSHILAGESICKIQQPVIIDRRWGLFVFSVLRRIIFSGLM